MGDDTRNRPRTERASRLSWIIPAAVGLGAFLLFGVQPIVGKAILPWFGGTAAVWITCLLVFQVGLLLGYSYAYLIATYVPLRMHGPIHAALVVASCAAPILPGAAWIPEGGESLAPLIVPMLAATVGSRYVVLAASGTLLQFWYARVYADRSPYALYALSNAGSMLALFCYPFVVEPTLGVAGQARAWNALFLVFAVLIGWAAWTLWRQGARASFPEERSREVEACDEHSRGSDRVFWIGWSMAGVTLFMATTQRLTINVASTPLLWIVPLAIYLATFIVTFLPRRTYSRSFFVWLLLPALIVSSISLGRIGLGEDFVIELDYRTQAALILGALVVFLMICHGELYRSRPRPSRLAGFYFCIALGGALGGAFVALVAPRLFLLGEELHAGILITLGLLGTTLWKREPRPRRRRTGTLVLVPVCIVVTLLALVHHSAALRQDAVWIERNDYGLLRVLEIADTPGIPRHLRLYDGVTLHGAQFVDPSRRRLATTYYSVAGGGGALLSAFRTSEPRHVGVIGLGTGTLATYGRSRDRFRFYEINPSVVAAATGPFEFLSHSEARCEIRLGDARLLLEREAPQQFDVLVLDAFSSDSIPVHLLTIEAFELYLRHLSQGGVIAAHISNRNLDLSPLFYGLAERFDLNCLGVETREGRPDRLISRSTWMILTRNTGILDELAETFRPWISRGVVGLYVGDPQRYRRVRLWSDAYSNPLQVMK